MGSKVQAAPGAFPRRASSGTAGAASSLTHLKQKNLESLQWTYRNHPDNAQATVDTRDRNGDAAGTKTGDDSDHEQALFC